MTRHIIGCIVLRLLGLLLLAAAVLKCKELLTIPMANNDLWTNHTLLVFEAAFELGLGLGLLSGLYKRLAWLGSLLCFLTFCGVTLYKGLTGAESCGCFGQVHINPWITLWAIDVPAVLLLLIFRPAKKPQVFRDYHAPIVGLILVAVVLTAQYLYTHEPARVTAEREVLESRTWIDQPLHVINVIEDSAGLQEGNWLVMLFHYDCTDCQETIPQFHEIAENLVGNEDMLRLAQIEVPPYGYRTDLDTSPTFKTRMDETKEWLIVTPTVVLMSDGIVKYAWEPGTMPTFDDVLVQLEPLMAFTD